MAWGLSPETWRWAVSLLWSCRAEIAGTGPKVKPGLASPNWEQLLTTHKVHIEGSGEQGMMMGSWSVCSCLKFSH